MTGLELPSRFKQISVSVPDVVLTSHTKFYIHRDINMDTDCQNCYTKILNFHFQFADYYSK